MKVTMAYAKGQTRRQWVGRYVSERATDNVVMLEEKSKEKKRSKREMCSAKTNQLGSSIFK